MSNIAILVMVLALAAAGYLSVRSQRRLQGQAAPPPAAARKRWIVSGVMLVLVLGGIFLLYLARPHA